MQEPRISISNPGEIEIMEAIGIAKKLLWTKCGRRASRAWKFKNVPGGTQLNTIGRELLVKAWANNEGLTKFTELQFVDKGFAITDKNGRVKLDAEEPEGEDWKNMKSTVVGKEIFDFNEYLSVSVRQLEKFSKFDGKEYPDLDIVFSSKF